MEAEAFLTNMWSRLVVRLTESIRFCGQIRYAATSRRSATQQRMTCDASTPAGGRIVEADMDCTDGCYCYDRHSRP